MRRTATIAAVAAAFVASAASAEEPVASGMASTVAQAPAPASDGMRTFNIPAQSLGTAITAFGRQAGIQVTVDASISRGVQTQGVAGTMTAAQALNQLLSGTGIVAQFTSDRDVMLTKPQSGQLPSGVMQLDPVQVQGYPVPSQAMIDNLPPPYAGGQVATGGQLGLLGNRAVMDTPFNQTSYTAKKAQEQQAKTLREALIDDPSVRLYASDFTQGADAVTIRGFPVLPSAYAYGGLYGILSANSTVVELAERVEVLKGPSAMLNGMQPAGSIGGTINIVPKRARDEPLTQATASYISAGQVGGHVDFGRRFGADKLVGVRFNGVFRAGPTELRYNSDQRALAVLGLDFRGESVRLSADLGYQSQYVGGATPYLGLAAGVPLPWAPNIRTNPTAQPWGYNARKDAFVVARAEVDLAANVTAYAAVGAHDARQYGMSSNSTTITSFYGDATAGAPLSQSVYNSYFTADGGLRALVDTGPIGHELAVTATTYSQTSGLGLAFAPSSFSTNINNATVIAPPGIQMPQANKTATSGLSSIGFADTLSAAEKRIQLTAGGRFQRVSATNFNITSGVATDSYDQSAFSPAVAVVIKPWENVSVYGNWIQGLQQGATVPTQFTNAGTVFPPYKSTQYEVGLKVDWGKLTTTASVFQISQPSIVTDVANNTQTLGGEQRNQGLEFNLFGQPIDGVRLVGGAMFLNPVLTKTQRGLTDGWIAPMVPQITFNLYGEWDLPYVRGLTLNGRIIYTGSQYIDTAFPRRSIPEWTRFDLGFRYAFENPAAKDRLLVARFNVENVLDTNYWAGAQSSLPFLGAPRTFRLALTADF